MKYLLGLICLLSLNAHANVFGDEPPIRKSLVEMMASPAECLRRVRQIAAQEGYQRPEPSDEAEDVGIKDQTGDWIGNSIYDGKKKGCIIHIWTHTFN